MHSNLFNGFVQWFAFIILIAAFRVNGNPAPQSASSERFFDLNSLFGRYPNTNYNRPYYGSSGSGFNYPNSGYPGVGYPNAGYPGAGYPGVGYPNGGGYPNAGYPNTGYPNVGYPGGGYGTNMLGGNGGYGGFGGNGGFPTYLGYRSDNYYGNRNNGFGYQKDTSTNGLSQTADVRDGSHGHRGYN